LKTRVVDLQLCSRGPIGTEYKIRPIIEKNYVTFRYRDGTFVLFGDEPLGLRA